MKGKLLRVEDHEEVGEVPGAVRHGLKNKARSFMAYVTLDVPVTACAYLHTRGGKDCSSIRGHRGKGVDLILRLWQPLDGVLGE